MSATLRECVARGCGEVTGGAMYLCRRHWEAVPPELQARIYRADGTRARGKLLEHAVDLLASTSENGRARR